MRLHAQTALIKNGFVYVPQSAPWLAEYLHEMTVFPIWRAGVSGSWSGQRDEKRRRAEES
jgi:hypothetical protein